MKKAITLALAIALTLSLTACGGGIGITGDAEYHIAVTPEPTRRPAPPKIIKFGGYDWFVLDVQGSETLIISARILENRVYYEEYPKTTWKHSDIRQYLNGEFYDSFSEADKARIIEVSVVNDDILNPKYHTDGGNNTTDKIFLLSIDEAERYFLHDSFRIPFDEPMDGDAWWWLRLRGDSSDIAPHVNGDGTIGGSRSYSVNTPGGVRPALWISPEPTPTPEPTPMPIIEFGGYNWLVLDVQGSETLIISEDILEERAYHEEYIGITWEHSDIRQYLNGEFYGSFSEADRGRIIEVSVINDDNPQLGTDGGNNTMDKVFLLSIDEANHYFSHDSLRVALNTNGRAGSWWLRTPGDSTGVSAGRVNSDGTFRRHGVYNPDGVRPAMWINLEP